MKNFSIGKILEKDKKYDNQVEIKKLLIKQQQKMLGTLLKRTTRNFCFFNSQISQKYGKKCCRYNQNGEPLPLSKVQQTHSALKQFLQGWKIRQEGLRLVRHFYIEDYPTALEYIKEVIKIDMNEFKQCPTYKVEYGELLTLELYSLPLKGLSTMDFHLAIRINHLNHREFQLQNIENENEYKKEYQRIRMKRESKRIQKMLDQDTKEWTKPEQKVNKP